MASNVAFLHTQSPMSLIRPCFFGDRNELVRARSDPFRMLPADQGFGADDAVGVGAGDRLIVKHEFIAADCAFEIFLDGMVFVPQQPHAFTVTLTHLFLGSVLA